MWFFGLILWRSPIRLNPGLSFATLLIQTCQTYVLRTSYILLFFLFLSYFTLMCSFSHINLSLLILHGVGRFLAQSPRYMGWTFAGLHIDPREELPFGGLLFVLFRTYPLQISNMWFFGWILWKTPLSPFSGLILWRSPILLFPDLTFGDLQFISFRTYP